MSGEIICPCCLNKLNDTGAVDQNTQENTAVITNLCCDRGHALHKECLVALIESNIESTPVGSCLPFYCPFLHDKDKRILNYEVWKQVMRKEIASKYQTQANSLLIILCGSCHSNKTLAVTISDSSLSDSISFLRGNHFNSDEEFQHFENRLRLYEFNEVKLEEFYQEIFLKFDQLKIMEDKESWSLFKNILLLIQNPERRNNLHLRYLRDRPRIWTNCCQKEHCFRCKTKDYHTNKTCETNLMSFGDCCVLNCPQCAIPLVKSDGCNTITCVCGHQFSWTTELESIERSTNFSLAFPDNTSQACVKVLARAVPGSIENARSWRFRNIIISNKSFIEYWVTSFPPYCSSQAVIIQNIDPNNEALRIAKQLYSSVNASKIQKSSLEIEVSKKCLFTSLFLTNSERFHALRKMNSLLPSKYSRDSSVASLFAESAKIWLESNKSLYSRLSENWEKQSTFQFLFLFGNQSINNKYVIDIDYPSPTQWESTNSSKSLTFTNDYCTVKREGGVSTFPTALAKLKGAKSSCSIVLNTAKLSRNWFSFGLVLSNFSIDSSDGIGRSANNSWGICDNRLFGSKNISSIMQCGNTVCEWRKLVEGDILIAIVNTDEGWFEIILNEYESSHKFEIPSSLLYSEFSFGVTLANDHQVSLFPTSSSLFAAGKATKIVPVNKDQAEMFTNFKKYLRKLLSSEYIQNISIMPYNIQTRANQWDSFCEGYDNAVRMFQLVEPMLEELLKLDPIKHEMANIMNLSTSSSYSSSSSSNSNPVTALISDNTDYISEIAIVKNSTADLINSIQIKLTWNKFFDAVCWYVMYFDMIESQRNNMLAQDFISEHLDSSTFMAAAILAPSGHSTVSDDHTVKKARAFMKIYPDFMNEWYEYNASLTEPLLEMKDVARECFCVPRHYSYCPNLHT